MTKQAHTDLRSFEVCTSAAHGPTLMMKVFGENCAKTELVTFVKPRIVGNSQQMVWKVTKSSIRVDRSHTSSTPLPSLCHCRLFSSWPQCVWLILLIAQRQILTIGIFFSVLVMLKYGMLLKPRVTFSAGAGFSSLVKIWAKRIYIKRLLWRRL